MRVLFLLCVAIGSSNYSTGFALHIKYVRFPNPTYVRIFNISTSHLPDLGSKVQLDARQSLTVTHPLFSLAAC